MFNDRMFGRAPRAGDLRFSSRSFVEIPASVRQPGLGRMAVSIIDLSMSGFRMRCMTRLSHEKAIYLSLPSLSSIESQVCWCEGEVYGCEFSNGLHPAVFNHIVMQYPSLKR